MNQTLQRTPIDFYFQFLTEKTEYDYTNDWVRIGVPRSSWRTCNKRYKFLLPISDHGLVGMDIDLSTNENDFLFYDEDGTRIKKSDDKEAVCIQEYKEDIILKGRFQGNETYFINDFKLDQTIFDIESWLLDNLNYSFRFVLGIATERQVDEGYWGTDSDGDVYWIDGCSHLQALPYISFSDDTDAMAYKLKYL